MLRSSSLRFRFELLALCAGVLVACTHPTGAPRHVQPAREAALTTRATQMEVISPEPLVVAASVSAPPNTYPSHDESVKAVRTAKVERLLRSLTLEQKVGQLMMVGFAGTQMNPAIASLVRGRQVGGVCMFRRNVEGAEQLARLNEDVRRLLDDGVPPFIALDQEGGNVVRVEHGNVVLPGNMALGATHSPHLAYLAGRAQAEDLLLLGFNMNLAPVLDVNLNPKNPVIGIRSFGDRPSVVAEFGAHFVRGQQDANIVTVAKHFPGHGATDADSHDVLPVMAETGAEVMDQILPFTRAFEEGLDGVMTAHVAIPKLTGHPHPATVAREILTDLLREQLRFGGLVITDELEMEAIATTYGVGRAAVLSVQAGADMVLVPWRVEKKTEVYDALLQAARTGELPASRLDDAVRRILEVKLRRGLFEPTAPLAERLAQLGRADRLDVVRQIARQAVTLLRTDARVFPLRRRHRIAVMTAEPALADAILARAPQAQVEVVPVYPSSETRAELRARARELAEQSDVMVVGLMNSRQVDLVMMAQAAGTPVIVVSMGLPYLVQQVQDARVVLVTYSNQASSTEAAAASLFGEQGTPGRLPVTLSRAWEYGFGLDPHGRPLIPTAAAPSHAAGVQ